MDYNNELIGIIDKIHSNVDTQATPHNCYRPTLSVATEAKTTATETATAPAPLMTTGIPNLIDFDDCQQHKHTKSTETSSFDEISVHNVCMLFVVRL